MRTRLVTLFVVAIAFLGLTAPTAHAQVVLQATLTGAAVPGGGDAAGSGFAYAVVDPPSGRICVVVFSRDIGPPHAVHIHKAPAGAVGPHAVDLNAPVTTGSTSISAGCYQAPPAVLAGIEAEPADYYVNVHNHEYPLGALRGQLGSL